MSARKPASAGACSLLALAVAACAGHTAPSGWLADPDAAQQEAFGGWMSVSCATSAPDCADSDGELIAVHPDSVYVLTFSSLRAIPRASIESATLMGYDSHKGDLALWGFLGTVGTLSHGLLLIFTAPIWIIAGTSATSAQSRLPRLAYPNRGLEEFRFHARFPQGLPPGFDAATLRRKPFP